MRVLYFIDSLAPGGAETSLAALAPHYRDLGVELEVASLHDRPGLQARFESAGTRLWSISGPGHRLGWLVRATRLVRDRQPDLVHTTLFESDLVGRLAARTRGIPLVSSLVNVAYSPDQNVGLRTSRVWIARTLDAATARLVTCFHAVSEHVAREMSRRLHIRRDRIVVVPRGRDSEAMGRRTPERRARVREGLGVPEEAKLLVAAARQERQKGLDVLLEAVPEILRHQPVVVAIAGREGNDSATLVSIVERLGTASSVRFLGARSDIPDLLSAADAFVYPSRWEGAAGALLEAMALEAPIVASDIPPIREIVSDPELALLVRVGDPGALAQAVVRTLRDPDASTRRAQTARVRFLEQFTVERTAEGIIDLYKRALVAR